MILIDNRIIVDLNKVQFAKFYYKNQFGNTLDLKPTYPTSMGLEYKPDNKHCYMDLTMEEYAVRFKLKDKWVPHVYLQLSANHKLVYSGPKAQSIYKEWNKRIFNKRNK